MEKVKQAGIKHIFNTSPTPDTVRMFRALHELGMNAPGYSFYAAEMISADEAPDAVARLRRRPLVGIDLVDGQPDRITEVPDADRAVVARNLAHVEQRIVR